MWPSEIAGTDNKVEVILGQRARRFIGPAAFRDGTGRRSLRDARCHALRPGTRGYTGQARPLGSMDARIPASAVVAPDLDPGTAGHPAVRENLELLREDGCRIVEGAEAGWLLQERSSPGCSVVSGSPMGGLRLLVTAGGTREPIDSVRFIGNRSSGKMGLAVAAKLCGSAPGLL